MDDFEKTTVRVGIKLTEVTAKSMLQAAGRLLKLLLKKALMDDKTGMISIGRLMRDGSKLASMEMQSPDFKTLARVMKRYNIGVSLVRHDGTNNYTLFFKAKNEELLSQALKEYMRVTLSRETQQPDTPEPNEAVPQQEKASVPEHSPFALQQTVEPSAPTPDAPANLAYSEQPKPEVVKATPPPRSIPAELTEARAVSRAMQMQAQAQQAEKAHVKQRGGKER